MEPNTYSVWHRLLSIATCIATLCTCGLAMTWMPKDRSTWAQVASDFKLKVSGLTEFIFQVPDALVWGILALFAISAVLALGLIRSPKRAILLHFALMAITGVSLGIWEKAINQVVFEVTVGLAGGSKSS